MLCKHKNFAGECELCEDLVLQYNKGHTCGYSSAITAAAWVCRKMGANSPIDRKPMGFNYAEAIEKLAENLK